MIHRLAPGETVRIKVDAHPLYSLNTLEVKSGEQYAFHCPPSQRWKDWFYRCRPDGYFNLLTWLIGTRVRGAKCFCLCGVFDLDDRTGFPIGTERTIDIEKDASLSFFANDSLAAYWNNSGCIRVQATRVK